MVNKKTAFCKISKVLYLSDRLYNSLSLGAVGVYCFMLERKSLSYSNSENWTDSKGEVFIHFSREDVEHFAKCKHDKASKIFRELESAVLIRRVHQGLGRPDRIYVYDLSPINSGYTVAQRESKCDTYGDDKTDDEKPILQMSVNPDLQTDGAFFPTLIILKLLIMILKKLPLTGRMIRGERKSKNKLVFPIYAKNIRQIK